MRSAADLLSMLVPPGGGPGPLDSLPPDALARELGRALHLLEHLPIPPNLMRGIAQAFAQWEPRLDAAQREQFRGERAAFAILKAAGPQQCLTLLSACCDASSNAQLPPGEQWRPMQALARNPHFAQCPPAQRCAIEAAVKAWIDRLPGHLAPQATEAFLKAAASNCNFAAVIRYLGGLDWYAGPQDEQHPYEGPRVADLPPERQAAILTDIAWDLYTQRHLLQTSRHGTGSASHEHRRRMTAVADAEDALINAIKALPDPVFGEVAKAVALPRAATADGRDEVHLGINWLAANALPDKERWAIAAVLARRLATIPQPRERKELADMLDSLISIRPSQRDPRLHTLPGEVGTRPLDDVAKTTEQSAKDLARDGMTAREAVRAMGIHDLETISRVEVTSATSRRALALLATGYTLYETAEALAIRSMPGLERLATMSRLLTRAAERPAAVTEEPIPDTEAEQLFRQAAAVRDATDIQLVLGLPAGSSGDRSPFARLGAGARAAVVLAAAHRVHLLRDPTAEQHALQALQAAAQGLPTPRSEAIDRLLRLQSAVDLHRQSFADAIDDVLSGRDHLQVARQYGMNRTDAQLLHLAAQLTPETLASLPFDHAMEQAAGGHNVQDLVRSLGLDPACVPRLEREAAASKAAVSALQSGNDEAQVARKLGIEGPDARELLSMLAHVVARARTGPAAATPLPPQDRALTTSNAWATNLASRVQTPSDVEHALREMDSRDRLRGRPALVGKEREAPLTALLHRVSSLEATPSTRTRTHAQLRRQTEALAPPSSAALSELHHADTVDALEETSMRHAIDDVLAGHPVPSVMLRYGYLQPGWETSTTGIVLQRAADIRNTMA